MKRALGILLLGAGLFMSAASRSVAQTNLTGVVVDDDGKPIPQVACRISGFLSPGGSRVIYSGMPKTHYTDEEGRFEFSVQSDQWIDLQFDHEVHAPVFRYAVKPAKSPLRVVMTRGKMLNGKIVDNQGIGIKDAAIELEMPQEDLWYQRRGHTDGKGKFHFRISKPPQKRTWMLYYGDKRFKIDYDQITPETVVELRVDGQMTLKTETSGAAEKVTK